MLNIESDIHVQTLNHPPSRPTLTDEEIEKTFFQECAPAYGGMTEILFKLFQEKNLDKSVLEFKGKFVDPCTDIAGIDESIQGHRASCKILQSALQWARNGIPVVNGENALLQQMHPILNFILAGTQAIFETDERVEVTYSSDVTDNGAKTNSRVAMSKKSLSLQVTIGRFDSTLDT